MWEWAIVGACYVVTHLLISYWFILHLNYTQLHRRLDQCFGLYILIYSILNITIIAQPAGTSIFSFMLGIYFLYFSILRWSLHVLHLIFLFSGDPQWYHHHPTFNSPRIKLAAGSSLGPLRPLQPGGRHHLHQVHHPVLGPASLQQPPHHGIFSLLSTGRIWEVRPLSTIHYMELNLRCLTLPFLP